MREINQDCELCFTPLTTENISLDLALVICANFKRLPDTPSRKRLRERFNHESMGVRMKYKWVCLSCEEEARALNEESGWLLSRFTGHTNETPETNDGLNVQV